MSKGVAISLLGDGGVESRRLLHEIEQWYMHGGAKITAMPMNVADLTTPAHAAAAAGKCERGACGSGIWSQDFAPRREKAGDGLRNGNGVKRQLQLKDPVCVVTYLQELDGSKPTIADAESAEADAQHADAARELRQQEQSMTMSASASASANEM